MTDIYFAVLINEDVFTKVCTLKRSNSAVAGIGQAYSTCVKYLSGHVRKMLLHFPVTV